MTGIFAAAAFFCTARPPAADNGVIIRTFTLRRIISSAICANFASSPSAFSMNGSMSA